MKKLTLNIDDLGLSPAVNEAVCRLAEARRIHSASLMSLGELPHETLARLHASDCELGLHLDLTAFAPNTPLHLEFVHKDGSKDVITCNHTYNAQQIGWFKAGSALNQLKDKS